MCGAFSGCPLGPPPPPPVAAPCPEWEGRRQTATLVSAVQVQEDEPPVVPEGRYTSGTSAVPRPPAPPDVGVSRVAAVAAVADHVEETRLGPEVGLPQARPLEETLLSPVT